MLAMEAAPMRARCSFVVLSFAAALMAQGKEHPAASLGLLATIPWSTDGYEAFDHGKEIKGQQPPGEVIDAACARAQQEHKLVLWYVHRIRETKLQGRQMYRAPVLD